MSELKKVIFLGEEFMKEDEINKQINDLIEDARKIIEKSRSNAVRSVDFCRVQMYWNLGKRILEEEQQGKDRADYGIYLIKNLTKKLEKEYGSGFGIRQLERARQFFKMYPIASTLQTQLNWSQYKLLISISDSDKREYYELQMYVNYYDRKIKLDEENPTIGILLCSSKNDTAVKMALPENNNTILASEYQLYLPTSEELVKEINEVKQLAHETEEEK